MTTVGGRDVVVIGGDDRILRGLDFNDGSTLWELRFKGSLTASPTVLTVPPVPSVPTVPTDATSAGQRIAFVGCDDGNLYRVALPDRPDAVPEVLGHHATGGPIVAAPAVDADGMVLASWAGDVRGVGHDGARRWRIKTRRPAVESPLLVGDADVAFSDDRGVMVVNRRTGATLWRGPSLGVPDTALVHGRDAAGVVRFAYGVAAQRKRPPVVHLVRAGRDEADLTVETGGHAPAAVALGADPTSRTVDRLFVATSAGQVHALGIPPSPPPSDLEPEHLWNARVGEAAHAATALPGPDGAGSGAVVVADGSGAISLLAERDGSLLGRVAIPGRIFALSAAPAGRSGGPIPLLVASDAGQLWRLAASVGSSA